MTLYHIPNGERRVKYGWHKQCILFQFGLRIEIKQSSLSLSLLVHFTVRPRRLRIHIFSFIRWVFCGFACFKLVSATYSFDQSRHVPCHNVGDSTQKSWNYSNISVMVAPKITVAVNPNISHLIRTIEKQSEITIMKPAENESETHNLP